MPCHTFQGAGYACPGHRLKHTFVQLKRSAAHSGVQASVRVKGMISHLARRLQGRDRPHIQSTCCLSSKT